MLLLLTSLFLTNPVPLDMPRAEGYIVKENETLRLEDRYDKTELWITQTVIGRWMDDDDRVFSLSCLDFEPPAIDAGETLTRRDYVAQRTPMKRIRANRSIPAAFRRAIETLAPEGALTTDEPRHSRQLPRGYRDVDYWQHPTNYAGIVCAFRPEKSERWYLAAWKLVEGDDYVERMQVFEERFLGEEARKFLEERGYSEESDEARKSGRRKAETPSERELLRADARHSVAAYSVWHFTDSAEFAVIDDLPTRGLVSTLTNEFAAMRAKYAAALPTEINVSNTLCVARVYASRAEYLCALETDGVTNLAWSAAYWSPMRRELVAHLPESGEAELLKTIRHEAFHQYLSYATSMIPTSPWLNEGYAQYFEDVESSDWGVGIELTPEGIDRLAQMLPGVLAMDYRQFYDGTDLVRNLKYRLAWSVAYFIENGADKVRFQPFRNLKRDYFASLFRTEDMRRATATAFGSEDAMNDFIAAWKKFWKNR